eukprot:CAMPEP_0118921572 /NCGR_PEP_ID=MMETSP1169-20130426/802_1 /TAXON_ID=36882 /ORGANISM="Pyramimonas obovata, Strain CCMP722" /LENGTH=350 /DNA_ID=CAMNT_0006862319 /DNA_START=27 /DNA_END=1079 /DNA_ORIENTATION=+
MVVFAKAMRTALSGHTGRKHLSQRQNLALARPLAPRQLARIRPSAVQRGRLCVYAADSEPKRKVSIKDMKCALTSAGVDTSSCFEREELEERFFQLTEAQQNVTQASGSDTGRDDPREKTGRTNSDTQAGDSNASTASSSTTSAFSRDWAETVKQALTGFFNGPVFDNPKKAWKQLQSEIASGAVTNKVRVTLTGIDAKLKVTQTLNRTSAAIREQLISIDEKLKVSATVKREGPGILAKINSYRQTQWGGTLSTLFLIWFVFSGALWSTLSFSFPIIILSNWIFPGALSNTFQDFAENIRRAQGGAAGFDGNAGQQGFSNSQAQAQQNKSGASSSYGPVVDVEAEVKDK